MGTNAALNDNSQLDYTQSLRRRVADKLVTKLLGEEGSEQGISEDPKLLNVLLNTLKDHDKVTLTLKRIDAENENADADREALALFHKMSNLSGSRDVTRVDTPVEGGAAGPSNFNPADIPSIDLVEGELKVGADPVDYERFMAEQGKKHRDSLA